MTAVLRIGYLATALLVIGITACTSRPPSFGERLQGQGKSMASIGDQWVAADELIAEGRELIEEGEEKIAEGRRDKRKGEEMVARGERMKREAEAAYDRLTREQGQP